MQTNIKNKNNFAQILLLSSFICGVIVLFCLMFFEMGGGIAFWASCCTAFMIGAPIIFVMYEFEEEKNKRTNYNEL